MEILGNYTTKLSAANDEQLQFRTQLHEMYKASPLPEPELERNIGLYLRSSLLARFLALSDVYKKIVDVPGAVFDLGCWWGQASVLMENFRALYEPFNKQRKIVCFDTFEGYSNWSNKDSKSESYNQNTYSTGVDYPAYLRQLLETHEGINNLGHQRGMHEVVAGDATKTVPDYLKKHGETIVALSIFDLGLYEPTKAVLKSIKPHVVPGSVLLMVQLTRKELCGDGKAFLEVFSDVNYKISKHPLYPSFSVVEIK